MGKKDGKPRGKMSAYAFFVQTCREEHKKKHPGESVVFAEFSKKCAEKWKSMGGKEKKRFEEMAEKDKARWEKEMEGYVPPKGEKKRRKRVKDPSAPKRALSAFFFFCQEERASVKSKYPSYGVGDIAKELGKRWEVCTQKPKFEALAQKDKARYEKEMAEYKKGGSPAKKAKVAKKEEEPEDDDDDEEEEEDDDDEDDD
jgi:hypothetical protein